MTAADPRESGYGVLLRTVAASLVEGDAGASQALERAAGDVEGFIAELVEVRARAELLAGAIEKIVPMLPADHKAAQIGRAALAALAPAGG